MIISKVWCLQRRVKEEKLYHIATMYMNPLSEVTKKDLSDTQSELPTFPENSSLASPPSAVALLLYTMKSIHHGARPFWLES